MTVSAVYGACNNIDTCNPDNVVMVTALVSFGTVILFLHLFHWLVSLYCSLGYLNG